MEHLEKSLAQNCELKEVYRDKNMMLQARMEELFNELEQTKREVVSITELREDRDQRIEL
jgi:hypothetical protein